ncbi:hypothetical protein D4R99_04365 [bacterium]|nr:MAG: hypothetical protein D4R99_04365 [bacterium]
MINYTSKFFNLVLLRISDIKLHENTEFNRLRNIYDRIAGSRFLMNPVIVGRINNGLILIDGANRLSSLREIGCKLVIAQVIDYTQKKIKLRNWDHLIYDINLDCFKFFFAEMKLGFAGVRHSEGEAIMKNKLNSLMISDIENNRSVLVSLPAGFNKMLYVLNSFTKFYFGKYEFDRSEEEITLGDLKKYSRRKGVLVEFPRFSKEQIVKIACGKNKLPAGISRHILDNRVLHVRYEINKLKEDSGIEQKNNDLRKYLLNKIDNNKVRQYSESVIVFDE